MEHNQQPMTPPEMMITLRLRPMVGSTALSVEEGRAHGFQLEVSLTNIVGTWAEAIPILADGIKVCLAQLRKEQNQPVSLLDLPPGFVLPLLPGSHD